MPAPSRLAGLLRDGRFVVTAELTSTNSADPEATWRLAEVLRGSVDAVNCTDNTGAHVHMSSLAAAHLLVEKGIEPIMQLTVRAELPHGGVAREECPRGDHRQRDDCDQPVLQVGHVLRKGGSVCPGTF